MTIIETTTTLLVGDHDGSVCLVEEHPAHENVCTICKTLHMPSMLRVEYCPCDAPDLEIRVGTVVTGGPLRSAVCSTCEKPNLDAIRHPLV